MNTIERFVYEKLTTAPNGWTNWTIDTINCGEEIALRIFPPGYIFNVVTDADCDHNDSLSDVVEHKIHICDILDSIDIPGKVYIR